MTSEQNENVTSTDSSIALEERPDAGSDQPRPAGGEQTDAVSSGEGPGEVKKAEFQSVSGSHPKGKPAGIDLLLDVTLPVTIELGRTTMFVKQILSVCEGSVIELERAAGEPADIMVGNKLLGRGEVVVMNDRFGVRVTELVNPIDGDTKA
jgi:flagellar motor switch protein FliN/FliY